MIVAVGASSKAWRVDEGILEILVASESKGTRVREPLYAFKTNLYESSKL